MIAQYMNLIVPTLLARIATEMKREEGQDLVEYALILVFISIASIAALMALGPQIAAIYTQITETLSA